MTFELSLEQEAVRDRARGFAEERLAAVAAAIDDSASIPPDVLRELQAVVAASAADATALVVSVEQLAIASPAAAARGNARSLDADRADRVGRAHAPM